MSNVITIDRSARQRRRRYADCYQRDAKELFHWMEPGASEFVGPAMVWPYRSDVTRRLCKRLYRDLKLARALPRYLVGRDLRVLSLKDLFAAECAMYRRQRRMAAAAE